MKLTITKMSGKLAWEWLYTNKGQFVAGGYCATKKAAASDAAIWLKSHIKNQERL